jgi:uncharacterized protein (TIGR03083 family)
MKLTPAYDQPSRIAFEGSPAGIAAPLVRQRRRLQDLLGTFDEPQWQHATRCDDWRVRDVVAHLVTVNDFWTLSVRSGIAGSPTRILETFDPAAHPPMLVAALDELPSQEVYARFVTANAQFLGALDELGADGWSTIVETPAGHVPAWALGHHALWDSWIHERDVALPLGIEHVEVADEVAASLRYAAVIGPALRMSASPPAPGTYGVVASDPETAFTIEIDDTILVREAEPPPSAPCLRGPAVALVDGLSVRLPLPEHIPRAWRDLASELATVFDMPVG